MGKTVKPETERAILQTIETVNNLQAPALTRLRRRVRTVGGGGSDRAYLVITTVTNKDEYVGDTITPTSATPIKEDVTIETSESSEGLLKVGDKMWADVLADVYYISPATFLGA